MTDVGRVKNWGVWAILWVAEGLAVLGERHEPANLCPLVEEKSTPQCQAVLSRFV